MLVGFVCQPVAEGCDRCHERDVIQDALKTARGNRARRADAAEDRAHLELQGAEAPDRLRALQAVAVLPIPHCPLPKEGAFLCLWGQAPLPFRHIGGSHVAVRSRIDSGYALCRMAQSVFIAGGTGFIGQHVIPVLLQRGHHVRALVRAGSEHKLPLGCDLVTGNPLDRRAFADRIGDADTYVHLIGVPNPSPAKASQFFNIDLPAAREAIDAAAEARMRHFVFVSVAQPAPIMKAYQQARAQAEGHLALARLNATILRPWYVIGRAAAGRSCSSLSTASPSACRAGASPR